MFAAPGERDSLVSLKPRYDNFIGGTWIAPVKGVYMKHLSPTNRKAFCEVARSSAEDVELALDAAHRARCAWAETSLADRAKVLNRIADVMEANLTMLASGALLPDQESSGELQHQATRIPLDRSHDGARDALGRGAPRVRRSHR